jgi:hypothetical protein
VYEHAVLNSTDAIDKVIDGRVFEILNKLDTVKRELIASDLNRDCEVAFGMLLACVLYRKRLNYKSKLLIGTEFVPVARLLRSQAFFLFRDHQDMEDGDSQFRNTICVQCKKENIA